MPDQWRATRPKRAPSLLSESTCAVLSFGRRSLEDARLGFRFGDEPAVARLVLSRHPDGREALLEPGADCPAVETWQLAHGSDGIFLAIDDEAGDAVLDDFRHGAGAVRNHGRPARHCLDHHQTERLGPVDR